MAAALRVINFYERDNIERQRLPRVFKRHLPWDDFSDEELLKRYRFGRESLLFIARLIEDEVRPLTRRNQAISTQYGMFYFCARHTSVSAFNCAPCGELVHTGIGWGGGGLN